MDCGVILVLTLQIVLANSQNYTGCDYYQLLEFGSIYRISSPGRGSSAPRNTSCRYAAEAPYGYKITASCTFLMLLYPFPRCKNSLKISRSGRTDLADATLYCGFVGRFDETSINNRMTIQFLTDSFSFGSRFQCRLSLTPDSCECGRRNTGRVVGGNETLINEFPLMAAIVQGNTGVWCGATIISINAAVSAAHCFDGTTNFTSTKLVVGEHNISTSLETRFTRTYNVKNVTIHEKYNRTVLSENDVALVFTTSNIVFGYAVSPSCLPFRYEGNSFSGASVTGIGWGTTEFAGPRSDVLRKVYLTVMNETTCNGNLLCTSAKGQDLCQYDSGGPILYLNTNNSLLYNIGVISSGDGCGTAEFSTNVRVTAYLDWILSKTMSTVYCVK